jgi:hypothetical protein
MTYSTKDKEMFNTNKAVQVYFNGTVDAVVVNSTPGAVASPATTKTSIAYADIYIPFPVKEIHVRSIDIDWNNDYFSAYFISSLVDNGPLGGGFLGQTSEFSHSIKSMRYIFSEPRDINGSYRFEYLRLEQRSAEFTNTLNSNFPSVDGGGVVFMLEFIGYK